MPKLKVSLSIGFSGATQRDILDVPQEELDACANQEEVDLLLEDYWKEWSSNYIDGGIELLEEGDK